MVRTTLALLLLTSWAHADNVHVDVGASYRYASHIDLAALAGSEDFGVGDDTSPGALGLRIGLGYARRSVEFWLDGRIGVGGLSLGDTEPRYFGETDTVGSSASAELGGHALFKLGDRDLELLWGPGVIYHVMSAASGVGTVGIRSVGVGGRAGVRWRTHDTKHGYGYVEFDADAYLHLPTRVFAESADESHFSIAGDGSYGTVGVSLVYGWAFSLYRK